MCGLQDPDGQCHNLLLDIFCMLHVVMVSFVLTRNNMILAPYMVHVYLIRTARRSHVSATPTQGHGHSPRYNNCVSAPQVLNPLKDFLLTLASHMLNSSRRKTSMFQVNVTIEGQVPS